MEISNEIQIYRNAAEVIKEAILQSQYQAAKLANAEQLALYYGIGKYVSENTRNGYWGTKAIPTISKQLKSELPGLRGFSETNIKHMRQFYEAWSSLDTNSSLASDELSPIQNGIVEFRHLQVTKSNADFIEAFLSIGFTNHRNIITKVKDRDKRIFYILLCAERHLDTTSLVECINAKTYESRGQLPNNFLEALPSKKYAKRAIMAFKDEYLLDFINVEQLGERDEQDIDEKVIENGIVENIKKFIMMFGRGFAFIGNQHRIEVGGQEFFIDLLFYNRELSSLVAIELKAGDFKPSYLGQLNFYLTALDEKEKLPHENPSIGLVLCKSTNKTIAEYAVRDFHKPMGVATYKTSADMPERLRKALPDLEDLKKIL